MKGIALASVVACGLLLIAVRAQACPPGIPIGGNPACIPPSVPGSPHYVPPSENSTPQPIGRWRKTWGAITVDLRAAAVGASKNRPNEQEAVNAAVSECKDAGGKDCKVTVRYENQCAALAWPSEGGHGVGSARAPTEKEASTLALKECGAVSGKCYVFYSACSLPIFESF